MNKNLEQIKVKIFNHEIGILAYDSTRAISYFQYNPEFLKTNKYKNIFPFIIKRVTNVQVFKTFQNPVFRTLPPMIADSLPDSFGNEIFNTWAKLNEINPNELSPIHQLGYLSNRAMGALEYFPSKIISNNIKHIDLDNINTILNEILNNKKSFQNLKLKLNDIGILTILHIGTSAGGARAKVIVSEHKKTGLLIPGDINISEDYNHYLIKLPKKEDKYNRELVEYAYYKLALESGINMMPTKLINNKYFATKRYDRQNGKKQHVLTATGISGVSFKDLSNEKVSYNYLFKIANEINIPASEMNQLFTRMVFNYTFHNVDDHFKNHSFLYNENKDRWHITPAYDLNYSLDALQKWRNAPHTISLNGKKNNILTEDLLSLAKEYRIKNPKKIILHIHQVSLQWRKIASELDIPENVIESIEEDFKDFKTGLKQIRGVKF